MGKVVEEGLQCGYHGLIFDRSGACVRVPGSILQWTGAAEAGAYRDGDTSNSKLAFRLFHGLTLSLP